MVAGTTVRLALMGEPTGGSEEGDLLWAAVWGSGVMLWNLINP